MYINQNKYQIDRLTNGKNILRMKKSIKEFFISKSIRKITKMLEREGGLCWFWGWGLELDVALELFTYWWLHFIENRMIIVLSLTQYNTNINRLYKYVHSIYNKDLLFKPKFTYYIKELWNLYYCFYLYIMFIYLYCIHFYCAHFYCIGLYIFMIFNYFNDI